MENKESKIGIYDDCYNPIIFSEINGGSRCLDVGCWTGNLGKKLIMEKGCQVDGIDFSREALAIAEERGYEKTFILDLNDKYPDFDNKKKYDYIIFADVLEHLADPSSVLKIFQKYLSENGYILISIPNIAFIYCRFQLLFGRFNYNPNGGIMDAAHLRFFTKKSLKEMCLKSGYKISHLYGYSLVKPKFFPLKILAKIWPEMLALQFFIRIKK